MPSRCSRLNRDYQELLTLQGRFSVALTEAMTSGDFSGVALLKAEITEKKQALEGEINPFEAALKIREQYETQKQIYERIHLLEKREGILGMEGIDGKWYEFPSLSEVNQRFCKNKEMLDIKTDQGFTELLIVPFGMSLAKFTETMRKTLLAHYAEMPHYMNPNTKIADPKKTKLFAPKKNPQDPDKPLKLDTAKLLYVRESYIDADTNGTLVYFPNVLTKENHGGQTKKEILMTTRQGFQILLIEQNPIIPAAGTNEIIGTKQPRKRLAAGDTPDAYLETLQTQPEYKYEQGLTPEAWMTQFLLHLEETNQVIDDREKNSKANLNIGGWFPASSHFVPLSFWGQVSSVANLNWRDLRDPPSPSSGARSAVTI